MITIPFENCNDFSQNIYDQMIDDLQLNMVECTCGKKGCLIRYGHYNRYVKLASGLLCLNVQREWCRECGTSHALFPSLLVPYSQMTIDDQQAILSCVEVGDSPASVMEKNNLINSYLIKTISIRDTYTKKARKENFYHGILLGLLGSEEDWIVQSNAESGEGFGKQFT